MLLGVNLRLDNVQSGKDINMVREYLAQIAK